MTPNDKAWKIQGVLFLFSVLVCQDTSVSGFDQDCDVVGTQSTGDHAISVKWGLSKSLWSVVFGWIQGGWGM